jgi:hypothetical protein
MKAPERGPPRTRGLRGRPLAPVRGDRGGGEGDAMTVGRIQWALASVFFILGGWALLAPRSVIELTLLPQYRAGTCPSRSLASAPRR